MYRDHFRILLVDLTTGKGSIETLEGRDRMAGGSGLAALLFEQYAQIQAPWHHPAQPLIFAIGPLTGAYPLMSKTIFGFKSPVHDQYTESHGGGRSALALRLADLDALVVVGRSPTLCFLDIGSHHLRVRDAGFMRGLDIGDTGQLLRRMTRGSGHRSILRIGPAGENGLALANINVDTYRHFGRMGGGAAMGAKNLKAIVLLGDATFDLPEGKSYAALFKDIHQQVTDSGMLRKYHDLGTPANLETLNELKALPWRNLKATADDAVRKISGRRFAEKHLLRNSACAGCPVGCIHVGFIREKFMADHRYLHRQVAYDYEPIFSLGTMLGVTQADAVLHLLDLAEQFGLDAMSAGVALAWATEASEQGLIGEAETIVPLAFGQSDALAKALAHLAEAATPFYQQLGQGTLAAARVYGGRDFACVLGQEMAGYATGETFFVAQSLGFRHSHLDTGAYSYDQKHADQDVEGVIRFLIDDEANRCLLTSMVSCLFARSVYTEERLGDCLAALGYSTLAAEQAQVGRDIQQLRWQLRAKTGFHPAAIAIPRRFSEVSTWKGQVDPQYMQQLQTAYGNAIEQLIAG